MSNTLHHLYDKITTLTPNTYGLSEFDLFHLRLKIKACAYGFKTGHFNITEINKLPLTPNEQTVLTQLFDGDTTRDPYGLYYTVNNVQTHIGTFEHYNHDHHVENGLILTETPAFKEYFGTPDAFYYTFLFGVASTENTTIPLDDSFHILKTLFDTKTFMNIPVETLKTMQSNYKHETFVELCSPGRNHAPMDIKIRKLENHKQVQDIPSIKEWETLIQTQ